MPPHPTVRLSLVLDIMLPTSIRLHQVHHLCSTMVTKIWRCSSLTRWSASLLTRFGKNMFWINYTRNSICPNRRSPSSSNRVNWFSSTCSAWFGHWVSSKKNPTFNQVSNISGAIIPTRAWLAGRNYTSSFNSPTGYITSLSFTYRKFAKKMFLLVLSTPVSIWSLFSMLIWHDSGVSHLFSWPFIIWLKSSIMLRAWRISMRQRKQDPRQPNRLLPISLKFGMWCLLSVVWPPSSSPGWPFGSVWKLRQSIKLHLHLPLWQPWMITTAIMRQRTKRWSFRISTLQLFVCSHSLSPVFYNSGSSGISFK